MKNFTINRKVYKAKEFDFNLVCDLEDEGISLEVMQDKPMSMMRAYFGICAGIGRNAAGEEMQKHIVSGGSFEEMAEAMSDAMEQSDFFRAIPPKGTLRILPLQLYWEVKTINGK